MKRWLPLLLAAMLVLGCAGCTKRQTVTVYRIETGGTALLHPETVTVPGGTDPVQVALDALGAKPGDSTCTNPVRDWLTIDGSRVDDDGTLWLTVTAVGLAEADGDVLHAPTTADELALTDPATDTP